MANSLKQLVVKVNQASVGMVAFKGKGNAGDEKLASML